MIPVNLTPQPTIFKSVHDNNITAFLATYQSSFSGKTVNTIIVARNQPRYINAEYLHSFDISTNKKITDIEFSKEHEQLFFLGHNDKKTKLCKITFDNIMRCGAQHLIKTSYKKQTLPFNAKCLSVNNTDDNIKLFGFEDNRLRLLELNSKSADTKKISPTRIEEIQLEADMEAIDFDKKNKKVIALLKTNELIILNYVGDSWNTEYKLTGCSSIPVCYGINNRTMVFRDTSFTMQIKSLSSENQLETVLQEESLSKITDICLNSAENELAVFYSNHKYKYITKESNGKWKKYPVRSISSTLKYDYKIIQGETHSVYFGSTLCVFYKYGDIELQEHTKRPVSPKTTKKTDFNTRSSSTNNSFMTSSYNSDQSDTFYDSTSHGDGGCCHSTSGGGGNE
jgi:hypothetical protein